MPLWDSGEETEMGDEHDGTWSPAETEPRTSDNIFDIWLIVSVVHQEKMPNVRWFQLLKLQDVLKYYCELIIWRFGTFEDITSDFEKNIMANFQYFDIS